MRKTLSILCAACALILTFSCKKEVPASLEVTPTELTWEWDDTKPQTVTVTANYDWSAKLSDESSWTLTPANDGKSFTVAPKTENKTADALTATVTITCKDLVKTVTCTQTCAPTSLEVAPIELNWEWNSIEPQTVTVTANYDWTATVSDASNWALTIADDGKNFTVAPKDKSKIEEALTATVTVTCKDLVKTITCSQAGVPFANGYRYIDLGLPSGLKWANCNVGAESPADDGQYFAWGETAEKDDYTWETYNLGTYYYTSAEPDYGMTKYNNTDGITTLEEGDDPATVTWGKKWRTPTFDEIKELLDNCSWNWGTKKNSGGAIVTGIYVTSKINGNNIFLPAAGYRSNTELLLVGTRGYYWSSSHLASYPVNAYYFSFDSNYHDWSNGYRCYGYSVRAVTK